MPAAFRLNCATSVSTCPFRLTAVGAQRLLPQRPLLLGGGPSHIEADQRPLAERSPLAAGEDDQAAHALDKASDRLSVHGVGRVELVAIEQQHRAAQRGLALPEPHQRLQLARVGRQILRADDAQIPSQLATGRRSHAALVGRLDAAQLHRGQRRIARRLRPQRGDALGQSVLRWGQGRCLMHAVDDAEQPVIQVVHAQQIMQHALVDAQRAEHQRGARADLDQPPAPQRSLRRQRAPVRIGQRGQGQAEGRVRTLRIAVRRSKERAEAGIQLQAGAQEQHVALEGREAEIDAERVQRSRATATRSPQPGDRAVRGRSLVRPRWRLVTA